MPGTVRVEKHVVNSMPVFVLHLENTPNGDGTFKNQFNEEFIGDFNKALDQVLAQTPPDAPQGAVVTISKGKHYCDGLDLGFVFGLKGEERMRFLKTLDALFVRLLTFPMITVAAVNGHAFAGGMLLALAHDFRVGNSAKGFWCMSEIDIPSRLTPGFSALINARLPARLAHYVMVTGSRLTSTEMHEQWQVVEQVGKGEEEVLRVALELASKHASKSKLEMSEIKEDVWWEALKHMRGNESFRSKPRL